MVRRAGVCRRLPNDFKSAPSRLGFVALLAAAAYCAGTARIRPGSRPVRQARAACRDLRPHPDQLARQARARNVRGRIVYDFSGTSCEGYALKFRQVTELDSGEGKVALSDLRTTTWEEGEGKSFRFKSQNYMDREQIGEVDGSGDRGKSSVAVKLSKPEDKKFDVGRWCFRPSICGC